MFIFILFLGVILFILVLLITLLVIELTSTLKAWRIFDYSSNKGKKLDLLLTNLSGLLEESKLLMVKQLSSYLSKVEIAFYLLLIVCLIFILLALLLKSRVQKGTGRKARNNRRAINNRISRIHRKHPF